MTYTTYLTYMAQPTYKNLKSYQQAVTIYDITVEFCKKYLSPKSRTVDQMEQAARSGKQNIVEGCSVSKNNPKNEIFLLGVARASFEELLEDYQDFLRQRGLPTWSKDDPRSLEIRNLYKTNKSYPTDKSDTTDKSGTTDKTYMTDMSDTPDKSYKTDKSYTTHQAYKSDTTYTTYKSYLDNPEKIANAMTTLINQTNYLLDMQIQGVKRANDKAGIEWETKNQKVGKILAQEKEKNKKFDAWIQEILQKED